MTSLPAPCGLVCTDCEAYQATQANDAAAIAKVAAEWTERYRIAFSPDDVWCDGCTSTSERTGRHCGQCPVRACARERGLATCAECGDYPCDPLDRIHRLAPQARKMLEASRQDPSRSHTAGAQDDNQAVADPRPFLTAPRTPGSPRAASPGTLGTPSRPRRR